MMSLSHANEYYLFLKEVGRDSEVSTFKAGPCCDYIIEVGAGLRVAWPTF